MIPAPRLSVVIPLRDVAPYLPTLIATLRRTEGRAVELLFVDDHSRDATPEIAAAALDSFPNARLLHLDATTGLSAGRNRGLDEATAPVVTFLDGDDWIAPGYLDEAVDLFERRNVDVMRVDHTRVTGTRRQVVRNPVGVRGAPVDPRDHVLPVHRASVVEFPTAWGGFYRRGFLLDRRLRFAEELLTAEDRDWWWRVLLADGRMSFEDLNGYRYRRGVATSLTQIGDARQLHYFDSLERSLAAVSADRDADRFLPKLWRGYLAIILSQHRRGARLTPAARQEQRRRTASVLARVPSHLLHRTLIQMAGSDVEELRSLGLVVPNPETLQLGKRRALADVVPDVDPDAAAGGAAR
ncbi:glycosyltransferase involved in cell wall biosynthesis [Amnibacterium kyonggiense]|uniref:Glycosyltransferase involved in cell wall biosynthesis n=1 Tax=Amnibacterium kyonggiense TaxID=595671 RepID=A0A4V3EAF5_9MICO|nr:glycosyltransferase involved in cell wall biosynthesis [Amnibacterium kyonggiense]